MTPIRDLPDRIVLALCIWGESRGEPVEGQIAVACVVRNRVKHGAPSTRYRDVCLAPEQFSCFNPDDPNFVKIQRAADMLMTALPTPELQQSSWIADGVMSGAAMDNTGGSRNYLTAALLESAPPVWAKDRPILARIGAHVFLNA